MKKVLVTSFILLFAVLFSSQISAQNPIPSYNVPVIADPTIFEEIPDLKSLSFEKSDFLTLACKQPSNSEEKLILIKVEKKDSRELQWATVNIYSLDGLTTYGPFTVIEGTIFEISVDDRRWGVRVINASSNASLSVWIEF